MSLLSQVELIGLPWTGFARALVTHGKLPASWRELVILRVAWRRRCLYEWEAHRIIGRHCGLSDARIAIAMGTKDCEAPDYVDGVLILATDELLDEGKIGVPTKRDLEPILEESEIIELTMLVGQYALLSMLCQTFELSPEPGIRAVPKNRQSAPK